MITRRSYEIEHARDTHPEPVGIRTATYSRVDSDT